jgi:hypothetical protein
MTLIGVLFVLNYFVFGGRKNSEELWKIFWLLNSEGHQAFLIFNMKSWLLTLSNFSESVNLKWLKMNNIKNNFWFLPH